MENEKNELVVLLRELADKLGTTSEEIYTTLIKQAKYDFFSRVTKLTVLILLLIPTFFGVYTFAAMFNSCKGDISILMGLYTALITVWAIILLGFIIDSLMETINSYFSDYLNPKSSAIKELFNLL